MTKGEARQYVVDHLRRFKNNRYPGLYNQLYRTNEWRRARTVAITMSTGLEINTWPVIKRAFADQKRIVIPKAFPGGLMKFYSLTGRTRLKVSSFGIREPITDNLRPVAKDRIGLVVVPGLAFTKNGDRLGFGGGYYDRYLRDYRGATIALARAVQLFDQPVWPVSVDDVRVQKVITDLGG